MPVLSSSGRRPGSRPARRAQRTAEQSRGSAPDRPRCVTFCRKVGGSKGSRPTGPMPPNSRPSSLYVMNMHAIICREEAGGEESCHCLGACAHRAA